MLLMEGNINVLFEKRVQTSLVVQWLKILLSHSGGTGWISGPGTRSHMLQPKPAATK